MEQELALDKYKFALKALKWHEWKKEPKLTTINAQGQAISEGVYRWLDPCPRYISRPNNSV